MKRKIHAVADSHLDGLLESLGLVEALESGSLSCSICGNTLTLDNIGCIYPKERETKLCCDNLRCLQKAIDETTPMRRIGTEGDEGEH